MRITLHVAHAMMHAVPCCGKDLFWFSKNGCIESSIDIIDAINVFSTDIVNIAVHNLRCISMLFIMYRMWYLLVALIAHD